ncbi:MAG: translational GTPase TypA [Deltaproteobacteria bacterium]|nr:translational GTPase TypA [Deltaproteobacteria bacterium]
MTTDIRNIAIIAHVDHGKTTLVDHLLKQSGTFRENESVDDRFMDSMDLERERGITIAAKNASFLYQGVKVNIVDTPGHSDFGGEVERILDMVDGAILLVDASEGPLPQTRFVLKKALEQNLKIIVCINKIDRPDSRINEVMDEIFSLFIDLDANDEQADFPVVYTIARAGLAVLDPADKDKGKDLKPMFDMIIKHVPPPKVDVTGSLQILVANVGYNDYVGRLAIGRIRSGSIKVGDEVLVAQENNQIKYKVTALFAYESSRQVAVNSLDAGDIAVVAGPKEITIGDTITATANPRPLPRLKVDEPTVAIIVSVNDGPFAGKEGKLVTSRNIKDRLERELLTNVALRMEPTGTTDSFKVLGRGELQLAVLLEQMRREGFELLVSKPQVVMKEENGKKLEPMELAVIDVAESFTGAVAQKLGERKGIMSHMENKGSGRVRMEFKIPARGLIGYRSEFLTDTRGTGLLNAQFDGYAPYKGDILSRVTSSLVSDRKGKSTAYALWKLEERGRLFICPQDEVYDGMVVGEYNKGGHDLPVNVCREKQLTNVRASGSDEAIRLTPVKPLTLETAMEWISNEELIEVTPLNIRIRCREIDPNKRKK